MKEPLNQLHYFDIPQVQKYLIQFLFHVQLFLNHLPDQLDSHEYQYFSVRNKIK